MRRLFSFLMALLTMCSFLSHFALAEDLPDAPTEETTESFISDQSDTLIPSPEPDVTEAPPSEEPVSDVPPETEAPAAEVPDAPVQAEETPSPAPAEEAPGDPADLPASAPPDGDAAHAEETPSLEDTDSSSQETSGDPGDDSAPLEETPSPDEEAVSSEESGAGETELPDSLIPSTNTPDPDADSPSEQGDEAPWDEALCDHANEHCIQAPACTIQGCTHIGKDAHGLDVPLCELGLWLLDRQDAIARQREHPEREQNLTSRARPVSIDLSLGSATIYRSGVYTVTGTDPGATLTIAPDRIVLLTLNGLSIDTLTISERASTTIRLTKHNRLVSLRLASASSLSIQGSGALHASSLSQASDAAILVEGGDVLLPGVKDGRGREMFVFPAAGATSLLLSGEQYPWSGSPDGDAHVFLSPAPDGLMWTCELSGSVLNVFQAPYLPDDTVSPLKTEAPAITEEQPVDTQAPGSDATESQTPAETPGPGTELPEATEPSEEDAHDPSITPAPDVASGDDIATSSDLSPAPSSPTPRPDVIYITEAQAGAVYEIGPDTPRNTRLVIGERDVTVLLKGASLHASQLQALTDYRLIASGESEILGAEDLHHAAISALDPLTVSGPLPADSTLVSGRFLVDSLPGAWQVCPLSEDRAKNIREIRLDGLVIPLVTLSDTLLMPAPGEHVTMVMHLLPESPDVLELERVLDAEAVYQLEEADGPLQISAATFRILGSDGYLSGTLAFMTSGTGLAENVHLTGRDPLISVDSGSVMLEMKGDNGLRSEGPAFALSPDAGLTLRVMEGRLLLKTASIPESVHLFGNIKVEGMETEATQLLLKDASGNPLPNRPMLVHIGEETYHFTSHYDGSIWLWGLDAQGAEVAMTDGTEVYASVVTSRQTPVSPRLSIENITYQDMDDGSVRISFACSGALSGGIQYLAARQGRDIPDTFAPDAGRAEATLEDGRFLVTLPPQPAGFILSFRVYAAPSAGVVLTQGTPDGFTFSRVIQERHLAPFAFDSTLDRAYTGKPYVCPLSLPEGAELTYLTPDGAAPSDVGAYQLSVHIPEGQGTYLPGDYVFPFTIRAIRLIISPDYNQEKFEGEEDPVFTYTALGLLPGDEVEGELLREEGEEAGNYAWDISALSAPDYYTLQLSADAGSFTILPGFFDDWDMGFGMGGGAWETLHPVRQEIVRQDGRKLFMTLTTKETLSVSNLVLGQVCFSINSYTPALFSPSFSWNRDTDEVLLRLRTQPEINPDRGYATLSDGSLKWGGRQVMLSWYALERMQQMGVDAISLNHCSASLTVPLQSLMDEHVVALIREERWNVSSIRYFLEIEPVLDTPGEVLASRPVSDGWTMAIYLAESSNFKTGRRVDITGLVDGVISAVDLEPIAELLETIGRYDEESFGEDLTLTTSSAPQEMLDTTMVEPYMPSEQEKVRWSRLMYNHRYLYTTPEHLDTFWCIRRAEQ